jgi:hypothetical protein
MLSGSRVASALLGVGLLCLSPGWAQTVTLIPGEPYLRLDGKPTFLLGRNATGWSTEQFAEQFGWAREAGERIVRLHLGVGIASRGPAGVLDPQWIAHWESILDDAGRNGLLVLPVLGVWSEWNDGSGGETWHRWEANPYNAVQGGPATSPAELLADTPCRQTWLRWLGSLVERWQGRPEILGWEVFSELNLVSGSFEAAATEFAGAAARVVRSSDPRGRLVTASLSGTREWPMLFSSSAVDVVQVHPYANQPPYAGDLGSLIISCVRERLARYSKPVFIGESGLDSRPPRDTLTVSPRAEEGVRQALWASVVSGACNGRMLWWEDGYDRYEGLDLRTRYRAAARPVARFTREVDFAGMAPAAMETSDGLAGAALASDRLALVWLRDRSCAPPEWPLTRIADGEVVLAEPGAAAKYEVEFWSTATGTVSGHVTVASEGGHLRIALPAFEGSIAIKVHLRR